MRVVSLVDSNIMPGGRGLQREPGLSLCVFTDDQQILFDCGLSSKFAANARRLNVELDRVSLAVLSHHHFDHGGGLGPFIEANSRARIYLRRSGTERFYLRLFGTITRRIGLDESLLRRFPGRFMVIEHFCQIAPEIFVLTDIGNRHPLPKGNRHLFVRVGRSWEPDDFSHELILVIRRDKGLVVFTGCSHHGILNMLDAVLDRFPGHSIEAVFGGLHLIDLPLINNLAGSREDVEVLGRGIMQYPVGRVYTGHCTGTKGYRILKDVMGEKVQYLPAGGQVEI